MSYSLYRVWNGFNGLRFHDNSLQVKKYNEYNGIISKVFSCKNQHEANFCLELLHKELSLGAKDATKLISGVIPSYNNYLLQATSFNDAEHQKLAIWLDGKNLDTAQIQTEAEELQAQLGKIVENIQAQIEKTEDENTKKIWNYILHSLRKVELILKNYDKLSLDFAVEECAHLNNRGNEQFDKFYEKLKNASTLFVQKGMDYLANKGFDKLWEIGSDISKNL